ncbi:putative secreted protein [Xanthomonas phaseoli pv. phaseoli]|uniref:SH3 domain-containing protein n=1 Tax=Xanthomonas phaseoli TaxID=1985254 RepID=UPI000C337126|nr:SH3 domain-containing protein [Xanthomonas phaseoli]SOO29483.1 putative secreted protein [Xanthomonas phaseoli pv. phaseoli]
MPAIQSLSLMVLIAMATPVAAQQTGHVDSLARLRAGPGDEYRLVGGGKAGNPVTVYGCLEGGRWCDVRGPDARCWIPAQAIVSGRGAVTRLVPKVTFALDAYWDAHYRGREWTVESERVLWRQHSPGDSLSREMMEPRRNEHIRLENERIKRETAEIDRAAFNRLDRDRRDDKIKRCERSGRQSSDVQSCISGAQRDYDAAIRERESRAEYEHRMRGR